MLNLRIGLPLVLHHKGRVEIGRNVHQALRPVLLSHTSAMKGKAQRHEGLSRLPTMRRDALTRE